MIKYDDEKIYRLFTLIDQDSEIKKSRYAGFRGTAIMPIRINHFNNPERVKTLVSDDFNAFMVIDAGHELETWGTDKPARSNKERLENAQAVMNDVVKRINQILSESDEFKGLKADVVNKEFKLVKTYVDRGDDGDDYYGMEVFVKFHY